VNRRLEGRRAVVVGVGSTIGRACAKRLAIDGAAVLVVDPDAVVTAEVAAAIGSAALPHTADLTTASAAESTAQRCGQLWDAIDILLCCGSAMEVWPEDQDTIESLLDVVAINIAGPLAAATSAVTAASGSTTSTAAPSMARRSAHARPIVEPTPTTTARRPSRRRFTCPPACAETHPDANLS
jgi:NAD(P)-dependent dehydrogenase (short-subunit alcohol dehydrogenase family)